MTNTQQKKSTLKKNLDDTFKQLSALGSYQFTTIVLLVFLLNENYDYALFLAISYILMKVITIPIKLIFFKERPKPKTYNNIIEKVSASSFPSTHCARITFLFLFFINFFKYKIMLSFFLLIIHLLTCYSRIYTKRHYLIDVLAGILLGTIIWLLTIIILVKLY